MEQEYKSEAAIYAVLEQEIDRPDPAPGQRPGGEPPLHPVRVPRSLIRVVLQRLQENGLVRIVPYKGTTVTRLNRRIVDELIYERAAVEARVLRDFSPHCTPAQRTLESVPGPMPTTPWPVPHSRITAAFTRPTACCTRPGLPPRTSCTFGARCKTPMQITAASVCWTSSRAGGWQR